VSATRHPADPIQQAASATRPLLEARELTRRFGPLLALDGVSFALAPGEFLTIFGPNGAGKTTLLRILGGALQASSGEVSIQGERVDPAETEWRRRIGVLSHQTFLYGHLSAAENLRFYAELYGVLDAERRVAEGLDRVGLLQRAEGRVRTFSRGMRQRLALARTLLHDPDIVLLDEPYTGLDAHAAAVLRDVLGALKDGRRTVVLVTHNLSEGLELADKVAVQVRGRFIHEEPRAAVRDADFARFYVKLVEAAG
jgi:heme exporter protein A